MGSFMVHSLDIYSAGNRKGGEWEVERIKAVNRGQETCGLRQAGE